MRAVQSLTRGSMTDQGASGKHILLLDDEEAILLPTAKYFRGLGCTVDMAREPEEAEALIRGPRGTTAESPSILFEYARKKNRESDVDRACVEAILDAARILPADAQVGINVHASTLAMDAGFVKFLATALGQRKVSPRR